MGTQRPRGYPPGLKDGNWIDRPESPPYSRDRMEETSMENILQEIPRCRELMCSLSSTCLIRHRHPSVPPFRTYFTPTPIDGFPYVHQAYPTQAVEAFPMPVLESWLRGPGFKVVARIFNYSSCIYTSDELPRATLTAAITAIASSTSPDVPPPSCISPPARSPSGPIPQHAHNRTLCGDPLAPPLRSRLVE